MRKGLPVRSIGGKTRVLPNEVVRIGIGEGERAPDPAFVNAVGVCGIYVLVLAREGLSSLDSFVGAHLFARDRCVVLVLFMLYVSEALFLATYQYFYFRLS
jgi:hypothetical protein